MCVYFVVCVAVVCSLFIFAPFLSLHNIISLLSAAHKLCVVFSVHIPNKIMCLRICSFRSVVAAFDFGAAVSLRFPARSPPPPLSLCGACILHENPVCLAMMMMKKSQALFWMKIWIHEEAKARRKRWATNIWDWGEEKEPLCIYIRKIRKQSMRVLRNDWKQAVTAAAVRQKKELMNQKKTIVLDNNENNIANHPFTAASAAMLRVRALVWRNWKKGIKLKAQCAHTLSSDMLSLNIRLHCTKVRDNIYLHIERKRNGRRGKKSEYGHIVVSMVVSVRRVCVYFIRMCMSFSGLSSSSFILSFIYIDLHLYKT